MTYLAYFCGKLGDVKYWTFDVAVKFAWLTHASLEFAVKNISELLNLYKREREGEGEGERESL